MRSQRTATCGNLERFNGESRIDSPSHRGAHVSGASERPFLLSVHGGLGAVLVLRNDGAAGSLYGEPTAVAWSHRKHRRVRCVSFRDRIALWTAIGAGVGFA